MISVNQINQMIKGKTRIREGKTRTAKTLECYKKRQKQDYC